MSIEVNSKAALFGTVFLLSLSACNGSNSASGAYSVNAGVPCTPGDGQCPTGQYCRYHYATRSGSCQPQLANYEQCDSDQPSQLQCGANGTCYQLYSSNTWMCIPNTYTGIQCEVGSGTCPKGQYCFTPPVGSGPAVCQPQIGRGQPCFISGTSSQNTRDQCAYGRVCAVACGGSYFTCQPPVAQGIVCAPGNNQCDTGLYCWVQGGGSGTDNCPGQCQPQVQYGNPCDGAQVSENQCSAENTCQNVNCSPYTTEADCLASGGCDWDGSSCSGFSGYYCVPE